MILEAENLVLADRLDGIGLALESGKVTAICGPNGAGKSSLLACLAGLLMPDSGQVTLAGTPLSALRPASRAQAIGYLPQVPEVAWDVSVETLVGLGRLPWPGEGRGAPVDAALMAMELEHLRARPVSRLSGGERARVLLARVLAGEPRWLLADEPLAMLDLAHGLSLLARLRAEAAAGRGVALVLHDLAAAMNHADRVVLLDQGRVIAAGLPAEALSAEMIARVWGVSARWLGEPGARALAVDAP